MYVDVMFFGIFFGMLVVNAWKYSLSITIIYIGCT